ncbi:MAG: phosphatidylserine decarboxylase family protein [Nitrospinae bacterium]|nr:phosphatidylserine decarboxylase family protein [Nitrospinota bacterium]
MKFPIASEGLMFIVPLAVVTLLLFALGWGKLAWFTLALTAFVVFFFRDPERVTPPGEGIIVAPADGKVVKIDPAYQIDEYPGGAVGVSIFLSVFNVHVQRTPLEGDVIRKIYNKGKFLAAWDHKASMDNEQTLITMNTPAGVIGVKQIAGLIARRIVNWTSAGQKLETGERFGLIRFGSRVDLIMKPGVEVTVKIGDVVTAGETVMARFTADSKK